MEMVKSACKVCNSPHLDAYEKRYYQTKGRVAMMQLEKFAREKNETIGRKSFTNHFTNHYKPHRIQEILQKGTVDAEVEKSKLDAINILNEIEGNLNGLKTLIGSAKKAKNLSDVVAVYREHRLTLQDIERLRNKLSSSTSMTKAELYKEIYWACSQLCPKCREKFWVKLDERLKSKGFT